MTLAVKEDVTPPPLNLGFANLCIFIFKVIIIHHNGIQVYLRNYKFSRKMYS